MANQPTIPMRKLGRNGLKVPALGFGLMGLFYDSYGTIPSEAEALAILDRAHERGNRFWDTSDLYGSSEEVISRWFKRSGHRDDIFLATKFGFVKGGKGYEVDSSYAYCKKACTESLRLLDIDCIDLYYLHSPNPDTPIEETMRAMVELQAEGKIRHIGLSAVSSSALRRAAKIGTIAAVQTDYSPFERSIESTAGTDLLATCRELGVGVVSAMPLGRGMVTSTFAAGEAVGDAADKRPLGMPRFMPENRKANVGVVRQFQAFAERKGGSTAQLALAWLLKQGEDIVPIPGTKRMKYMEENWAALDIELSDGEAAEIREFLETAEIKGDSLPPAFKSYGFRDTVEQI